MNEIKITTTERGLNIEARNEKFTLFYDEISLPWGAGVKWCEKNGGTLPSLAQLAVLIEFILEINVYLREQAKTELYPVHYWSSSELGASCAWTANLGGSYINYTTKFSRFRVRTVAAFQ